VKNFVCGYYFRVSVQKEKKQVNGRKSPSSEDLSHSNEEGENVGVVRTDSDTCTQKGGEDAEEAQATEKHSKKEKGKHKKKSEDKAKLKKEAQELRLASLSEGLGNIAFSSLRNVGTDVEDEYSEMEKSVNKAHNGFVNGESTKKSKVHKRKGDETGHDTVTNKKMR
jgi:hypothetical protein